MAASKPEETEDPQTAQSPERYQFHRVLSVLYLCCSCCCLLNVCLFVIKAEVSLTSSLRPVAAAGSGC